MMLMLTLLVTTSVFIASMRLTKWFLGHALRHQLLDVPNSRSSHSIATPRGGGVAIVLSTAMALLVLGLMGQLAWTNVLSLCGSGTVVAMIGFADDRRHLAPRWRLAGHFLAAVLALAVLGGAPPIKVMGLVLHPGWPSFILSAVYVVWMLNLTNFMDGIDAIATVEAITGCLGAGLLGEVAAPNHHLWVAPLVVAAAAGGFLRWNWPPARIFLGDVGSGFLGMTIAVLSLQAAWVLDRLFWSWVILFGVFIVDATVTLVRRVVGGERFSEAHRSHAYQHAAAQQGAHKPVTISIGLINVFWLLPIAALVSLGWLDGSAGALIAYVPLVMVAVRLQAGKSVVV